MMLEFRCVKCGTVIVIPDDVRDRPIVCYNCNSKQPVPPDANLVEDAGQISLSAAPASNVSSPRTPAPPDYLLVQIGGGLLIVIGAIYCVLGLYFAVTVHLGMALMIVNGILVAAGGGLLLLLRDMAVDLWYIRQRMMK